MSQDIPESIPYEVDGFTLTEAQRAKLASGQTVVIEIDGNTCLDICGAAGEVTHRRVKASYETMNAIADEVNKLFSSSAHIKARGSHPEPR
ncbi:DUF3945 domain-containing protein [Pantoea sp. SORGH_AS_0659]|uniref:DUF3945 domain-containing protein n=1 Tax=Pantoea sp. SORGH_AS_0659 TaxID=3062597 RepID=UPI00286441A2|nr:DUF3945 domain-containing protein [Pantoea sp. SORGH_AS_0659]MDR6352450.1 hypothetical protein [Pantoea sp. SORGH_AS_0659]